MEFDLSTFLLLIFHVTFVFPQFLGNGMLPTEPSSLFNFFHSVQIHGGWLSKISPICFLLESFSSGLCCTYPDPFASTPSTQQLLHSIGLSWKVDTACQVLSSQPRTTPCRTPMGHHTRLLERAKLDSCFPPSSTFPLNNSQLFGSSVPRSIKNPTASWGYTFT